MKNFLAIVFVIFSFCFLYNYGLKQDEYKVLGVLGNDSLYIDLNRNLKIDENELVKIKGVEPFPVKYSKDIQDISKKLNLSYKQIKTLGYIANKYLEENVKGRYVKLKNFENGSANVLLHNTDISIFLLKNGLSYKKDDDSNFELIKMRAKNARNVEYYIYDIENEILHSNNCIDTKNIKEFLIVKKSDVYGDFKFADCINKKKKAVYKKVNYPAFFNKGNVSLYLINPYLYNKPSNSSRTPVCKLLIKEINNSKQAVNFAIYGVDNQNEIVSALNSAKSRGVNVSGVSNSDEKGIPTYNDMFKFKNINITYDNKKSLMHNKFFVLDDNLVISGSMNISKTGCGGYNSNSVSVIRNKTVANAYKNEFNQMKNGIFKNLKKDYSISNVKVNPDTMVSVYFSPVNDLYKLAFEPEIKKAKNNIRVSIFVLTFDKIAEDLISASKRGVKVRVIADATGAMSHRRLINKLRENGINVKIENWGGKNHEKTISIDDNVLIMGSANFSYAAINKNDENLLVIKDREIVRFYNGFFDTLYNEIPDIYLKRFPKAESKESVNSCYDGIDNDFDGKIDFEDEGCRR